MTQALQTSHATLQAEIAVRQRAEAALRESEYQLRLVTDNVPVVIVYVDKHLHYRFVNRTFATWFGLSAEEVKGQHVADVLGDASYQEVRRPPKRSHRPWL